MRGILWGWLFTFGLLLWTSLCLVDYHRGFYPPNWEMPPDILPPPLIPLKRRQTSKFTFWKAILMFVTVIFWAYFKKFVRRLQLERNARVYSHSVDVVQVTSRDETETLTLNLTPRDITIHKRVVETQTTETDGSATAAAADGDAGTHRYLMSRSRVRTPTVDVRAVQAKLETLEKSIAQLREKRASGLVSGSPEFKKFLNKLEPVPLTA